MQYLMLKEKNDTKRVKKEKKKRKGLKNLRHDFGGVRKWSTLLERHREESLRINLRQEIRRRS